MPPKPILFRSGSLLLFLLLNLSLSAQTRALFWVFLNGSESCGSPALSPRSIERRMRQGIPLDYRDFPVCPDRVQEISATGVKIRRVSRWLNAVSVEATAEQMQAIQKMEMVSKTQPVAIFRSNQELETPFPALEKTSYDPGFAKEQIEMLGLDVLHANGYNGSGIIICMMDNGYYNANNNPGFSHLFNSNRVLATWDFHENEENVYDDETHGAYCFSILGGYIEGNFVGAAPGASYILTRTEVGGFERNVEEDNWVAAAEWADSIGADIFSTSLGYSTFDSGQVSYQPSDMDGNTTIITRAADLAASRGIVVVNAAGNEGGKPWQIITAPADGDSVLAVGAVNENKQRAGFSCTGPSADGRIKPDLMAMGSGTYFIHYDGSIGFGDGTSFACPLIAGLAACVWQSKPILNNMQVYEHLKRSANSYHSPDYFYGYGIPNGIAAFYNINEFYPSSSPKSLLLNEHGIGMYPNPSTDKLSLVFNNDAALKQVIVKAVDLAGKIVFEQSLEPNPFYNIVSFSREEYFKNFGPGCYIISVRDEIKEEDLFSGRFILVD